ncbi:MAG TPA: hypothetical protein VKV23_09650 [Acidimicrobiales bacterium]|nr:hypothetical protein [Acidimicrobiales bacterium]
MTAHHIVVDGSNLATEGRSLPSLEQLEQAVAALREELPDALVTVVVDATFAHRIDPAERPRFEEGARRGEYVSPPAGAIGRGDAFLLKIAQKVDGTVLSNDSFQEFHGEHPWLFERGRLLGASFVPGVGWIFVPRTPVRGPRSRAALRDAARSREEVEQAIAEATREVTVVEAPSDGAEARSARRRAPASFQAVNEPTAFIAFIAEHRLGDLVEGEVDSFTSHGAVVRCGDVRAYVPLAGLASPPPRAARSVLRRGERRTFALTALDPQRRGVELALPEVAVVSGHPSEETVEAELRMARSLARPAGTGSAGASRRRKTEATASPSAEPVPSAEPRSAGDAAAEHAAAEPAPVAPGATAAAERSSARRAPARRGAKRALDQQAPPQGAPPSDLAPAAEPTGGSGARRRRR